VSDSIQVGDIVTWRNHEHPNAIGFANCKVVELGEDKDGRPAALIKNYYFEEPVGALIVDLLKEEDK
jgi:hypothetical protein